MMRVAKWALAPLSMLLIGASAPRHSSAAPSASLGEIGGVYKHRFQNGRVDGSKYESEDILEIVPTGPNAAYFRVHLDFYNGHTCALSGIAHRQGHSLLYDKELDTTDDQGRPEHCRFRIVQRGKALTLGEDDSLACKLNFCGARGGFDGATFELSRRRPIRYMPRLKASREFHAALQEDAGR